MKIVVISFDDGTIYDRELITLLNRHGLKATLNLNSGLNGFTWYYDNKIPITRFNLNEVVALYKGMEVSSHTLTHPYLTDLSDEELIREINDDVDNLSNIFGYKIESFAVPMDRCNEHIIEVCKRNTKITNMRIPERAIGYLPKDSFHIGVNAWYDTPSIYSMLEEFKKNTLSNSLFVIAGHAYELMLKKNSETLDRLLEYLENDKEITVLTMKEACKILF